MLVIANVGGNRHPSLASSKETIAVIEAFPGDSYYTIWRRTASHVISVYGNSRILFVDTSYPDAMLVDELLNMSARGLVFCREQLDGGQRVSFDWWSTTPHRELDYTENPDTAYGNLSAFSIMAADLIAVLDHMPGGVIHRNDGHNIRLAEYARRIGLSVTLTTGALVVRRVGVVPSIITRTMAPPKSATATAYTSVARKLAPVVHGTYQVGAKLHIGAGGKVIAGFLNTDCLAQNGSDGVVDLQNLSPLPSDTFSVVYGSHVLEHTYADETPAILHQIYRILQPGGTIRLAVPDLRLIVKNCVDSQAFGPDPNAPLFGDYKKSSAGYDRHWQAFWYERLVNLLASVGFINIRRWSANQYPEIKAVNDWSCYETISLNLEADKVSELVYSPSASGSNTARVKVSVLLGTVNRADMLQECVDSIRESIGDLSYEIVVAYGDDTDVSLSWMREQKDIRPVLGGLHGAIPAFNIAYHASCGEYICQLNDDVLVVGDAIRDAVHHLDDNKDVGVVVFRYDRRDGMGYRHDLIGGKLHPNQMVARREVCELVVEKIGDFWGDALHRTDKTYGGDSAFGMICHHYGVKLVDLDPVKCLDRMHEANDEIRVANANVAPDHGTRWHAMYPVSLISTVARDPWGDIYVPPRGILPRRSPISAGRPLRILHLGLFDHSEPQAEMIKAFEEIGLYVGLSWWTLKQRGANILADAVRHAIATHKPELIWMQVQDEGFDPELLAAIRTLAGTECTIVNWSGDVRTSGLAPIAGWMPEFGKYVDLMLFSNCTYPDKLAATGTTCKTGYMQCAYDAVVNTPQDIIESPGIVFAGGSHLDNFGSKDRVEMCLAVNRAFPSRLIVYGNGSWHTDLSLSVRERISSVECAAVYAAKQVTLSISLFHDLRRYTSDRLKRAFGCGAVVALRKFDDYEGLGIVDGVHAMVWETHDELINKIKELLLNPSLRVQMRAAAHELAVNNFTWTTATEQMMAIVRHYRRTRGINLCG